MADPLDKIFGAGKDTPTVKAPAGKDPLDAIFSPEKTATPTSVATDLGRQGKAFGQGVEETLTNIAGLPGWAQHGINKLYAYAPDMSLDWATSSNELQPVEPPEQRMARAKGVMPQFWMGGQYRDWLAQHGMYDPTFGDKEHPLTDPEAFARGAGRGAPFALAAPVMGPEAAIYSMIPSGLADVGEQHGISPLITAPAASLSLAGGERIAQNVGEGITLANQARIARNKLNQFTASGAVKQAQRESRQFHEETPLFGQSIKDAADLDAADIRQGVNMRRTAAVVQHEAETQGAKSDRDAITMKLSPYYDPQSGVEEGQKDALKWWNEDFKGGVKKNEDEMNAIVGDDSHPVPLTRFWKSLTSGFKDAEELQPLVNRLLGGPRAGLAADMSRLAKEQEGMGMIGAGDAPIAKFTNVRTMRSALGELMDNPTALPGLSQQKISELYRELTGDVENSLQSKGADAVKAFKDYNTKTSGLYDLAGKVGQIIGSPKEMLRADKVIDNLTQGLDIQGSDLMAMRQGGGDNLNNALDKIFGSYLRKYPDKWTDKLSKQAKTGMVGTDNVAPMDASFARQRNADLALEQKNVAIQDWNDKRVAEGAKAREWQQTNRREEGAKLTTKMSDLRLQRQQLIDEHKAAERAFNELAAKQWRPSWLGAATKIGTGIGGALTAAQALGGGGGYGSAWDYVLPAVGAGVANLGLTALKAGIRNPRMMGKAGFGALPTLIDQQQNELQPRSDE
jgi:hypothetical protein